MENPFHYGEIVSGNNFWNREDEIRELVLELKSAQNIILYSPRRFGKTSLIFRVFEELRKEKFLLAYIDCYKAASKRRFLELYARSVTQFDASPLEKAVDFLREFIPNLRPKITIAADGKPEIEFDYQIKEKNLERFLEDIYDAPQRIAKKHNKKGVLVLDEFQELLGLGGRSLLKELRSHIQHHDRVAYVFMGSKKHLIYDIFTNKNEPFYNIGKIMQLSKISADKMEHFVKQRFRESGFRLGIEVIRKIIDLMDKHPFYTQMLCHELWNMKIESKEILLDDLRAAVRKIIGNRSPSYINIWDKLAFSQRNLLITLAKFGGEKVFSKEFVIETTLGTTAVVQSALQALIKKDLVEKENGHYLIEDLFFKEWLIWEMSAQ